MNRTTLSLVVGATLFFGAAGTQASPFTVDETALGLFTNDAFPIYQVTADKINGEYEEVITFDDSGNFDTVAFAELTQFVNNDNPSRLATVPGLAGFQYGLYGLFSSSGTLSGTNFTGTSGSIELWLDANADTTRIAPSTGTGTFTLGSNGDDYKLASASNLVFGFGQVVPGVGGFFELRFDNVALTGPAANYFISPNPFYVTTVIDGDFDDFTIAGTQTLNGDLSVIFGKVPEPASAALLGLGLLGMGWARRRSA